MEVTLDVDALRAYMLEYFGTYCYAPRHSAHRHPEWNEPYNIAATWDIGCFADIETMDAQSLVELAANEDIDLTPFITD